MHPIRNGLLTAALAALAASSAIAAHSDYYLKLDGVKGEVVPADDKAGHGWIEVQSWQWGEVNKVDSLTVKQGVKPASAPGGVTVATGDVNSDSPPDIAAAHEVKPPRDSSLGSASERRQHNPVKFSKPLERGSLTVQLPAGQCASGKHYDNVIFGTASMRYEMRDVVISSCAASGGGGGSGGVPMEQVSFNYGKIETVYVKQDEKSKVQVKGWDPEKKQQ